MVYETTPEADKGLRTWAIFVSQGYKAMLLVHPMFKALFISRPEFSWGLTTAYGEDQSYWCPNCIKDTLYGMTSCVCGGGGICCENKDCEERTGDAHCSQCNTSSAVKVWASAAAPDGPRPRFQDQWVDQALRHVVSQMSSGNDIPVCFPTNVRREHTVF